LQLQAGFEARFAQALSDESGPSWALRQHEQPVLQVSQRQNFLFGDNA
jgi:hypothetical protein